MEIQGRRPPASRAMLDPVFWTSQRMATFWGLWLGEGSPDPSSAHAGLGELWVVSKGLTPGWTQGLGQWLKSRAPSWTGRVGTKSG